MCRKGPEWLSIRSPAQKSIKPGVLKQYINPQSQCAEELVTWLENHGNNNPGIKDALMRYSADGITMRTIKITQKDAILNNNTLFLKNIFLRYMYLTWWKITVLM